MQFKSSLARLAAFAFFLLSFSMLACAAPAPGAGSLVARTTTDQCKQALADLDLVVKAKLPALVTCTKTPGCNSGSIVVDIVAAINVAISVIAPIVATVDISVCVKLCIEIIVYILFQLSLCVGLSVSACASIGVAITALLQLFVTVIVGLADLVLKATLLAYIKAQILVYLNLCLSLQFYDLLTLCGIPH